jgi:pyruvate/2-oxoglutarate/acetoin dehydrogenase E1 component
VCSGSRRTANCIALRPATSSRTASVSLTLVTNQLARREAEAAAEDLAARGVSVEIIDPRTLVPFDFDTVAASVRKTGRLLVVQEATFPGSWGATLAAWVASNLFGSLACGPSVLGAPEVPVPFAATLESAWLPSRDRITGHVLRLLGGGTGGGAVPVPAGSAGPAGALHRSRPMVPRRSPSVAAARSSRPRLTA